MFANAPINLLKSSLFSIQIFVILLCICSCGNDTPSTNNECTFPTASDTFQDAIDFDCPECLIEMQFLGENIILDDKSFSIGIGYNKISISSTPLELTIKSSRTDRILKDQLGDKNPILNAFPNDFEMIDSLEEFASLITVFNECGDAYFSNADTNLEDAFHKINEAELLQEFISNPDMNGETSTTLRYLVKGEISASIQLKNSQEAIKINYEMPLNFSD